MTAKITKIKPKTSSKADEVDEVPAPDTDYKELYNDLLSLSVSLVAEVDNLMTSNLSAPQTGKVLGDIMSGYSEQLELQPLT